MSNIRLENDDEMGAHLLTLSPEERSFLNNSETSKSNLKQPSLQPFLTSSALAVLSDEVRDIVKESPLLIKGK